MSTSAGWDGATRRATSRPTWATPGATCWSRCPRSLVGALNEYLAAGCYADLFRRVRGKPETKAERLEDDIAAMLGLPADSFEVRRVEQATVNSLSLVRFDRNDYSVPTAFAHHDVDLPRRDRRGPHPVRHRDRGRDPPRSWDKEGVFFDFRHYLALLERKPGAFDVARPLEGSCLPECLLTLRRRLEADLGHGGTREFIKVLRLLERSTSVELTGAVEPGARRSGRPDADAVTCILQHRSRGRSGCSASTATRTLKSVAVESPDLSAYRDLTAVGPDVSPGRFRAPWSSRRSPSASRGN